MSACPPGWCGGQEVACHTRVVAVTGLIGLAWVRPVIVWVPGGRSVNRASACPAVALGWRAWSGGVGRFRRCFGSGTEWVTHRMPRRLPRALASARAAPVLSATSGFSYSEAAKDAGDHPAHWVAKSTPSGMRSHQPCRPHRHPVRRHPRFRRCPPEFRRLVTDFADGTLCSRYRLQPRRVARQRRPRRVSLVGQDVPAARRPAKMGRAV